MIIMSASNIRECIIDMVYEDAKSVIKCSDIQTFHKGKGIHRERTWSYTLINLQIYTIKNKGVIK